MNATLFIHKCYLIIHKSIRAIGRSIEASNVLGHGILYPTLYGLCHTKVITGKKILQLLNHPSKG